VLDDAWAGIVTQKSLSMRRCASLGPRRMVSFARLARPDDNREHQTVSAAGLIVGYEARENVARTPR